MNIYLKKFLIVSIVSIVLIVLTVIIVFFISKKSQKNISSEKSYNWNISDNFGICSTTCGGGTRRKNVICKDLNGNIVEDKYCDISKKPVVEESCNNEVCVTYNWNISDNFGICSATCGGGTRRKNVICKDLNGNIVEDKYCDISKKPVVEESCNNEVCVTYNWNISDNFGICSATCGGGTRRKNVICKDLNGNIVEDEYCDISKKPVVEEECNKEECVTYEWSLSDWSNCSKDCGTGMRTRTVSCKNMRGNEVEDNYCNISEKPQELLEEQCNTNNCETYNWSSSTWNNCSKTCGGGIRTRTVSCKNMRGYEVEDNYCTISEKPVVEESCNNEECAVWGIGYTDCTGGFKFKTSVCYLDGQMVSNDNCNLETQPILDQNMSTC